MRSFLPILARELRAASRRRSTYRSRWWAALAAILIAFLFLTVSGRGTSRRLGESLFNILTGACFLLSLLAGVLLSSDCLSREKREGTLGLVFLAGLGGFEVVRGKFVAISLNSLYALLALLPVTVLPILLGGVSGGESWRMALALLNALFFSLAVGICVSAFSRDSQRAMVGCLGLLALVVGGFLLLPIAARFVRLPSQTDFLGWISPALPFFLARDTGFAMYKAGFWRSLVCSHLVGWMFLVVAGAALPRVWLREGAPRPKRAGGFAQTLPRRWRRPVVRGELLDRNPVLWASASTNTVIYAAATIVALWGLFVIPTTLLLPMRPGAFLTGFYGSGLFSFPLKILVAVQACRFFAEGRRDGTLEMLLTTPLTSREIVQGQWLALKRAFLWPALIFMGLLLFPVAVHSAGGALALNPQRYMAGLFELLFAGICAARFLTDLLAIAWFGMWLALHSKRPSLAPALTILLVLIVPSFLCWFDVFSDLAFFLWGYVRLQADLRRAGFAPGAMPRGDF